ncbi:MAG: hypothetical protein HRT57_09690, partial [Crocinitomicaceae bacterium]|nr:hypothetical protein [Crocinitomicaceae bacterium]
MRSITLLFILVSSGVFGQSSYSAPKHSFTVSPVSVTLHKHFLIGHSLKYAFNISDRLYTEVSTEGTVFTRFDLLKKSWRFPKPAPNFNQSHLIFGGTFSLGSKDDSKKKRIGGFIGAQYIQHASQDNGYWAVDSTQTGGLRTITGFKTYSIIAGVQYK